jgi:hypothetical protein
VEVLGWLKSVQVSVEISTEAGAFSTSLLSSPREQGLAIDQVQPWRQLTMENQYDER